MESYEAKIARRKRFQRVVSMLCCICVFITTYALILPAITMEAEADCGIKEHTHGDECYAWSEQSSIVCDEGHTHTSTCYDEAGTLICGKEEVIVVHTHDALCYDASGALICGLPEVAEHTHTDECYESIPSEPKCICEKEEDEHEHSDACRLICELSDEEEHVHTDACLGDVLVCELTETDGHTHGEECYGEAVLTCDASKHEHTDECHAGELICEQDGIDGHEHTPACYALSCEESKHEHTDECYTKPLICTLDECEPHTHIDTCYERKNVCGVEEGEVHTHSEESYGEEYVCGHECHKHTDECYEASEPTRGALICTKQEIVLHTHSDECYADVDGVRTLVCTQPIVIAHQHTADCIQTDRVRGDLTCELTEHAHTSTCWESYYTLPAGSDDDDDDYFDDNYDPDLEGYAEDVGAGMPATLEAPLSTNLNDYASLKDHVEGNKLTLSVSETEFENNTFVSYLKLAFKFSSQALGTADKGYQLSYKLPLTELMSVADLNTWNGALDANYSEYLTKNNRPVEDAFQFCFVQDTEGKYYVLIHYYEGYAKYIEAQGSPTDASLSFEAMIKKESIGEDGNIHLPWKDVIGDDFEIKKEEIEYNKEETANYDLHSFKDGSYDPKTKKLTYTVTVWSNKGTGASIAFEDEINANDLNLSTPTITVQKSLNSAPATDVKTEGLNLSADASKITMTLPALEAGERYIIKYTYDVTDFPAGATYKPKNTIKVITEPNEGKIESSDEKELEVKKDLLRKVGAYDAQTGTITWTITVNPNGDNIYGYTLTDSLFAEYSKNQITITPASGCNVKEANGKVSEIEFTGEPNKQTYTITYTKSGYTQGTTAVTENNKAEIKKNEENKEEENASVNIPALGVEKTGAFASDGNTINWTITIGVPEIGLKVGTTYTDYSSKQYWGITHNHWLDNEQITALISNLDAIFGSDGYEIRFANVNSNENPNAHDNNWVTYNDLTGDKAYGWYVRLLKEYVPADGKKAITISYSTTADLTDTSTFYNYFNNEIAEVTKGNRISKMNGSGSTETSVVSVDTKTLEWRIKVNAKAKDGKLTVEDFLPYGLQITNVGILTGFYQGYNNVTPPTNISTQISNGTYVGAKVSAEEYTSSDGKKGQKITFEIAQYQNSALLQPEAFTEDTTFYLCIQCEITPEFVEENLNKGESQQFTFKNIVKLDEEESQQTQKWTIKRELGLLKYDAKNDENASGKDTNFNYDPKDSTLAWYVRVYLEKACTLTDANPLTITENIPEGLTLKTVGIAHSAQASKADTNLFKNGVANGAVKASYTNTANSYTFTVGDDQSYKAGTYIYLYVECKINSDVAFTESNEYKKLFKNSASASWNGEEIGSDDQTQTVTKNGSEDQIIKSSEQNGTTITYTVVINGNGATLDAEEKNVLNFTDTLKYSTGTYNLLARLNPASVTLWTATYDPETCEYSKNTQVNSSDWKWTYSNNGTPLGENKEHVHTISGYVPNGKALILSYTYTLSFDRKDIHDARINNEFVLFGSAKEKDESQDIFTWKANTPVGEASSYSALPFYKIETGNNQKLLKGAVFTVYEAGSGDASDVFKVELTTDSNGFVSIKNDYIDNTDHYHYNTLYYIIETQAPAGYVLKNPEKYYFYFPDEDADNYAEFEKKLESLKSENVYNLAYMYSPIYVENEPIKTTLTINKKWLAYDETDLTEGIPDEITIKLYRKVNDVKDESFEKEYTLKASDSWTISITDLPKYNSEGKPYDYYAVEQGLDTNKYELIQQHEWLEIDDQKNPEKQDGTLTLTNKEIKKGKITVKKEWGANTTEHGITVELWRFKTMNKGSTKDVGYQGGDVDYDLFNAGSYQKIGDSITLSNDNSFTYTWDNLTLCEDVEDMTYYYYYFVIERGTSYVKSYTTQEVATADQDDELVPLKFMTNGTITITNSLKTVDITVNKEWGDIYPSDRSDVTFKLMQVKTLVNADSGESISTSKYGDSVVVNFVDETKPMTYTWENLPAYELNGSGEIVANYTYYVVEDLGENSLFKPTYSNATTNTDGTETLTPITGNTDDNTITVTNSYAYNYTLPVTGGSGTQMFTITGAVLMVGCAMLLAFNKKRRRGA